jgi:hypothetical protein
MIGRESLRAILEHPSISRQMCLPALIICEDAFSDRVKRGERRREVKR